MKTLRYFLCDGYGTWYVGDDADAAMDALIDAGAACLEELEQGSHGTARQFMLVRLDLSDAEVAALPVGESPLFAKQRPNAAAEPA